MALDGSGEDCPGPAHLAIGHKVLGRQFCLLTWVPGLAHSKPKHTGLFKKSEPSGMGWTII